MIFEGNGEGIYSVAENGVRIAASGEVAFKDNTYGIYNTVENGVSITGIDNAPITKLTISCNESGLVTLESSLDFNVKELAATGGENVAYAYGSGASLTLTA
ncbi:MAG: hypothetical protein LUD41_01815 [Phascolarctobacterium sp.]|nr:hypothetical protein [Phascolarctobacterium sp.]